MEDMNDCTENIKETRLSDDESFAAQRASSVLPTTTEFPTSDPSMSGALVSIYTRQR